MGPQGRSGKSTVKKLLLFSYQMIVGWDSIPPVSGRKSTQSYDSLTETGTSLLFGYVSFQSDIIT